MLASSSFIDYSKMILYYVSTRRSKKTDTLTDNNKNRAN
jgi:hypothetical protein